MKWTNFTLGNPRSMVYELRPVKQDIDQAMEPIARRASFAVAIFLPFCALSTNGVFGDFSANASLPLYLLFFVSGVLLVVFGQLGWLIRAPSFKVNVIFFSICAILALYHGASGELRQRNFYSLDIEKKAIVSSIVPFFLLGLIYCGYYFNRSFGPRGVRRIVKIQVLLIVLYSLLQFSSGYFQNPVYESIFPFVEGFRYSDGGEGYFVQYGRLSGPFREPAELAAFCIVAFLPWVLFSGRMQIAGLCILLYIVVFSSQSLGGVVLLLVLTALGIVFRRRSILNFFAAGYLVFSVMVFWASGAQEAVIDALDGSYLGVRLLGHGEDPSILVRSAYANTSIALILEHPFLGIGWSNEVFYFPGIVDSFGWIWEVKKNLETGDALAAKSITLRLALYSGLCAFLVWAVVLLIIVFRPIHANDFDRNLAISRGRFGFFVIVVVSTISGGILTSFFYWFWLGVYLCDVEQPVIVLAPDKVGILSSYGQDT